MRGEGAWRGCPGEASLPTPRTAPARLLQAPRWLWPGRQCLRDPRPTQGRLAFLRGLDVQGGDLGFLWVSGGLSRGPSYTCGQHTAGSGPRAGEGTDRHKGLDTKTPWILGVTRATPPIRAFLLLGMGLVGLEIRLDMEF